MFRNQSISYSCSYSLLLLLLLLWLLLLLYPLVRFKNSCCSVTIADNCSCVISCRCCLGGGTYWRRGAFPPVRRRRGASPAAERFLLLFLVFGTSFIAKVAVRCNRPGNIGQERASWPVAAQSWHSDSDGPLLLLRLLSGRRSPLLLRLLRGRRSPLLLRLLRGRRSLLRLL